MTDIQDIASNVSNNENAANDKFRDTFYAVGRFEDDAAASVSGQQSGVSVLKGILSQLGIATGSIPAVGTGPKHGNPNLLDDGMAAIGTQGDSAAAAPSSTASSVSIAKGILTLAGFH